MQRGIPRGPPIAQTRAFLSARKIKQRQTPALNVDLVGSGKPGIRGELEPLDGGVHEAAGVAAFERLFAQQRPAFVRACAR